MTQDEPTAHPAEASRFFDELFARSEARTAADAAEHNRMADSGWFDQAVMHRYKCKRGCTLAVVFMIDKRVMCAVRPYKLSPGLNEATSTPEARANHTLDADGRHWPGAIIDVAQLAGIGESRDRAQMTMNCSHRQGTVLARAVLEAVAGMAPGDTPKTTKL